MSSEPSSTPSGIITTETDERVIPSSRRADGSVRRERRVRAGYVPQEDVQVYQNRHIRRRQEVSAPPPKREEPKTPAQRKNEKRRQKKKEAKENESTVGDRIEKNLDEITENLEALNLREGDDGQRRGETSKNKPQTEIEIARKIRALEKKLMQADKLKEKADLGETLLPEQQEKVNNSDSWREELDALKKLSNK